MHECTGKVASIQRSASQETDQVHIDSDRLSKGASMTILSTERTSEKLFMSDHRICISVSVFSDTHRRPLSLEELRFDVRFSKHHKVTGHGRYSPVVEPA